MTHFCFWGRKIKEAANVVWWIWRDFWLTKVWVGNVMPWPLWFLETFGTRKRPPEKDHDVWQRFLRRWGECNYRELLEKLFGRNCREWMTCQRSPHSAIGYCAGRRLLPSAWPKDKAASVAGAAKDKLAQAEYFFVLVCNDVSSAAYHKKT